MRIETTRYGLGLLKKDAKLLLAEIEIAYKDLSGEDTIKLHKRINKIIKRLREVKEKNG